MQMLVVDNKVQMLFLSV